MASRHTSIGVDPLRWWWWDSTLVDPEAPALVDPNGQIASRARTRAAILATAGYLQDLGVQYGDRLALVYGPGPDQAIAMLAAMGLAAVAPFAQVGSPIALEDDLRRLGVTRVIVDRAPPASVLTAAKALDLPVLSVDPFGLPSPPENWPMPRPAEGDLALLMQSSGTTSRPKIVPLTHANLLAGAKAVADTSALGPSDRVLAAMPMFHIHGIVATLLAPLAAGGSVICCRDRNPETLLAQLRHLQPTWLSASPTLLIGLLDALDRTGKAAEHHLRLLRSVTMPLAPGLRQRLDDAFHVPILEVYGMTEASSQVCSTTLPEVGIDHRPGTVGPAAGPEVTVLSPGGTHCGAGVVGEIAIRGPSVTQGYEGASQDGWVMDQSGERWFLTGDEGCLDECAHLKLTGRLKEMINRGGIKISPARIDEALMRHPAVGDALAFALPHPTLGEDLMAAVVLRAGAMANEQQLRDHLIGLLAVHEVPSGIVLVDALPRGKTGKPLRRGLAEVLAARFPGNARQAEHDLERLVASAFADVLNLRCASGDANFFMLGGDSLSSIAVIQQLENRLGLELNPALLFLHPTVRSLANQLEQLLSSASADLLQEASIPAARARPVSVRDGPEAYLASFGQARLWFLQQAEPGLTAYHLPAVWRLRGQLKLPILESALTALVNRHAALRTSFKLDGDELVQIIHVGRPFRLVTEPLEGRDPATVVEDWIKQENDTPFDLESGTLIRGRLLVVDSADHILMINHHHIASDGSSRAILAEDLVAIYNALCVGVPPALPPMPVGYHDFAAWQRRRLHGARLDRHVAYWGRQLDGLADLDLRAGRTHAPTAPRRGAVQPFEIDAILVSRLEALCRSVEATVHMGFLATVALLLHRISEQEDFAIGIPAQGRNHPDLASLMGFFVNTLPIRTRFDRQLSFRQLLRNIRDTSVEAYDHQELPFDRIVKASRAERTLHQNPLFQVLLQFIPTPLPSLRGMRDLETERLSISQGATRFDLEFFLRRASDGSVGGELTYDVDLFDQEGAARLVDRLTALLSSAVGMPDTSAATLDMLPAEEKALIERWQAGPPARFQGQTVDELFARQVARSPEATALVFDDKNLTYAELSQRADRLADVLIDLGAGPECVVAVELDRDITLLIAVVAVIRAGAAYLPLDPAWPEGRRNDVLQASGATIVVTERASHSGCKGAPLHVVRPSSMTLPTHGARTTAGGRCSAHSLAYVLYTSGSTGQPKGVAMQHGALVNLLGWQERSSGPAMRTLQFASIGFDVSFQEIFSTWVTGGTLFLATDEIRKDPSALLSALERDGIERAFLPVVLLEFLARAALAARRFPRMLREICVAGEALRISPAIRQFFGHLPGCRLWNHYGPTETHVATAFLLPEDPASWPDLPPIGTPIANTQVHVLDRNMQPAPIGVAGDIWIGGTAVARGYWRNAPLTADRFVPDPFDQRSDARIYRTGDRGSWHQDGQLRFFGRTDNQVKIRGHRVELEDIEVVLSSHPDVSVAAITVSDDPAQVRTLTGFVACRPGRNTTPQELRNWLRSRLLEPMVPARLVVLPDLPLNVNGKLDRKALAVLSTSATHDIGAAECAEGSPVADDPEDGKGRQALYAFIEEEIAQVWRKLFVTPAITSSSHFFELGGDSLMAVQMSLELERILTVPVPVATLFGAPTVASLARALADETCIPAMTSLVALKSAGSRVPLFCIHGWGGDIFHFSPFAHALSPDQPVYGVYYNETLSPGLPVKPLAQLAAEYAEEIRGFRPSGPYYLLGYSVGGWFAYAVATELKRHGAEVRLFIFDTFPGCHTPWPPAGIQHLITALRRLQLVRRHVDRMTVGPIWSWPRYLATRGSVQRLAARLRRRSRRQNSPEAHAVVIPVPPPATVPEPVAAPIAASTPASAQPFVERFVQVARRYDASRIPCDVELFQASSPTFSWALKSLQTLFWRLMVHGRVTPHQLSFPHAEIFAPENIPTVAGSMDLLLSTAEGSQAAT